MTSSQAARVKQLRKTPSAEKNINRRMRQQERRQLGRRWETEASFAVSSPVQEQRQALERGQ
jgi:hypothetical protein